MEEEDIKSSNQLNDTPDNDEEDEESEESEEDPTTTIAIENANRQTKPKPWASFGSSKTIEQITIPSPQTEEGYIQKKRGRPRKNPFPENSLTSVSREHERVRWNKKGTAAFIKFVMKYLKTFTEDPQANQKAFYQRLRGILSANANSEDEEYKPIPKNEDGSVLTEIQIGGKLRQLMDSQRKLVLDNADNILDIAKSFTTLNWDLTLTIVNIDEAIGRRRDLGVEKTSILGILKELVDVGIETGDIDLDVMAKLGGSNNNGGGNHNGNGNGNGNGNINEKDYDDSSAGGDEEEREGNSKKRQRLDSVSRSLGYSINKFRVDASTYGTSTQNGDGEFPTMQSSRIYMEEILKQSLDCTSKICESFNKTILTIHNNQEKGKRSEDLNNLKHQIKRELKEEVKEELINMFKNEIRLELIDDLRNEIKSQLSGDKFRSELIREEVSKVLHELMSRLLTGN